MTCEIPNCNKRATKIMVVVFLGIITLSAAYIAFGENYIYNASESEIQDQWVTETCIRLQINSPECDAVYGGIMDRPSEGNLK